MPQSLYLDLLAQSVTAGVLAFAGISKLVDGTGTLLVTLNASGLVGSASAVRSIAPVVPFLEIGLAVWLVSGVARTAALISALALFSLFLLVLIPLGLQTGWGRACGCLGPIGATVRSGVALDSLIVCLLCLALGWRLRAVSGQGRRPLSALLPD